MILVADVGGTHTRLAVAGRGASGWTLARLRDVPTGANLAAQIAAYRAELGGARVAALGCCGAGPLEAERIRLTNTDCTLERRALARAAGTNNVVLANDFAAVAHAVRILRPRELRRVGGPPPRADASRLVLGAGTGLGVAAIAPGGTVLSGEGGHAELAACDEDEAMLLERLRVREGRVSLESVLSGPGLQRLFAAILDEDSSPLTAAAIAQEAWDGAPAAVRTLRVFTRWLGHVAANLALTLGAQGGVFIAGGIVPGWGKRFDAAEFRDAFLEHPRHREWLARVPLLIVRHPQPGLLGMAQLAHENFRARRAQRNPAKVY